MIRNLGKVLTIVSRQHVREIDTDADLAAFHAPSECYDVVERGMRRRRRTVRRHAEAVAQRPWRVIVREARRRGGPRWEERAVDRLIPKYSFFYGGKNS